MTGTMHDGTRPQNHSEETGHDTKYSEFTKAQKRWIILLVAFAGMFSPLSSFIYYPAIHTIALDLRVTITLVNLTVTSYMIVSGITPAIVGDLADMIGRRPIYLATFLVYFAANIGLALQRSYPALLVLRMLQSAGGSGTISIAYGVVSDIATPAERGSFVGAVLCGPNVAPSLGPILGGALAQRPGWPWIFWLLVILSGFGLVILFLFLPETARAIVGSGGFPTNKTDMIVCSIWNNKKPTSDTRDHASQPRRLRFPNPLKCLVLLARKDTVLIVTINGIYYSTYCCIQASQALLFIEIYRFEEIQAGLIYLPFGIGCALASFISGWERSLRTGRTAVNLREGKIMDRDYRLTAKLYRFPVDRVKGDDLSRFHIERARFRSSWYFLVSAIISVTGYGWTLTYKVNIAVPLMLQFFIGASITCLFNMCGTLLTDLNPRNPALAQASSNIVRCALSASGLAAVEAMISHVGPGWTFTIFSGLCLLTVPMILAEMRWGFGWRSGKQEDVELQVHAETGSEKP